MMIFGLEPCAALPDDWTPLEAVAIIKCLDEDGDVALHVTSTAGLNGWERLGMLTAAVDVSRAYLADRFEPDQQTEEDGDGDSDG